MIASQLHDNKELSMQDIVFELELELDFAYIFFNCRSCHLKMSARSTIVYNTNPKISDDGTLDSYSSFGKNNNIIHAYGQCTNNISNSDLHKSSGDLNNEYLLSKQNKKCENTKIKAQIVVLLSYFHKKIVIMVVILYMFAMFKEVLLDH